MPNGGMGWRVVAMGTLAFLLASFCFAQTLTPPPEPRVKPRIAKTYPEDKDGDAIEDALAAKATAARGEAAQLKGAAAQALLAEMADVELVFFQQITQAQIDDFIGLGGQIEYIFKAVSYGWTGKVPLGQVGQLPELMGSSLVLVVQPKHMTPRMDVATKVGRARPIWTNFSGFPAGFNGSTSITIAIVDTGVDETHPDIGAARKAYWKDYTSDAASSPEDLGEHGSHVAGIALGTGQMGGAGGKALQYTDTGDLTGKLAPYFDPSPINIFSGNATFASNAQWGGGGQTLLQQKEGAVGQTAFPITLSASPTGVSPQTTYSNVFGSPTMHFTAALVAPTSSETVYDYVVTNQVTPYANTNGDGLPKFQGVASQCRWAGAKVVQSDGTGSTLWTGAALDDLANNAQALNIKVLNLSILVPGDPGSDAALRDKVNNAVENGIVVCVCAGNDGKLTWPSSSLIDDPALAANALTVGAANDANQLTDYSSQGELALTGDDSDDYKPDVLAPGGSDYYSYIMSVDSNQADGRRADFSFVSDQQLNDYRNVKGTSGASAFAAGCAALVIDALGQTGFVWDFSSSDSPFYVKMLLCATATETNATRENKINNPTLERANAGASGFPQGKDRNEGFGVLNPDAAVEAVAIPPVETSYTGSDTLGGAPGSKRAWARRVNLVTDQTFNALLTTPATGDFDLYLYDIFPDPSAGTPFILASSAYPGSGRREFLEYLPDTDQEALLVVKAVSGSGTFDIALNVPRPSPTPSPSPSPSEAPWIPPVGNQQASDAPLGIDGFPGAGNPPDGAFSFPLYGAKDFSQGFGPGASWAMGYNYKTSQEARRRNWQDLKTNPAHWMSPYFLWSTGGTYFFPLAGDMMTGHGVASVTLADAYGTTPTAAMLDEAALYTNLGYFSFFTHPPKLDRFGNFASRFKNNIKVLKDRLNQGDYFVIGIPVFQSFVDYKSGVFHVFPDQNKVHLGYHALCVVGYDDKMFYGLGTKRGAFRVVNSWGTGWGGHGFGWVSYEFVEKFCLEAWGMASSKPFAGAPVVRRGKAQVCETPDYKITYSGMGIASVTASGVAIAGSDPAASGGVLNIIRKKGVLFGPLIPAVRTDGSFTKVFTQAPIGAVFASRLVSLTASGCHVKDVVTTEVGTVKMTAAPNQSWPEVGALFFTSSTMRLPNEAFTEIRALNPPKAMGAKPLMANVQLSGVALETFYTPLQAATLKATTKKNVIKGGPAYLSYGAIGIYTTATTQLAAEFKTISCVGGAIEPFMISDSNTAAKSCSVTGRGMVLTTQLARKKTVLTREGSIRPHVLYSAAANLNVSTVGGSILARRILGGGQMNQVSAQFMKYNPLIEGRTGYLGGFIAPRALLASETVYHPVPGETVYNLTPALSVATGFTTNPAVMVFDVRSIRGDLGVWGDFYAGASIAGAFKDGAITPKKSGVINSITTQKPSYRLPVLPPGPYIKGNAWVKTGTIPQFNGGGDHSGFKVFN